MNKNKKDFEARHRLTGDIERHCRLCFINRKPYVFYSFKTPQYSHLDEVFAFADAYGLDLPVDYIDLLSFANGGLMLGQMIPGPADWSGHCDPIEYCQMEIKLPRGFGKNRTAVLEFYSIIRYGEVSNGWLTILNEPEDLEQGFLVFAEDSELKFCLHCSGPNAGSVYVFDEEEKKQKLVNVCFTAFIESFTLVPPYVIGSAPRTLVGYFTNYAEVPIEHIPFAGDESEESITDAIHLALCIVLDGINTYCQNEKKAKKLQSDISESVFQGYNKLDVQKECGGLVSLIFGKKEFKIRTSFALHCTVSRNVSEDLLTMLMGEIVAELNETCHEKPYLYFIGTVQAQTDYISKFLLENDKYLSAFNTISAI